MSLAAARHLCAALPDKEFIVEARGPKTFFNGLAKTYVDKDVQQTHEYATFMHPDDVLPIYVIIVADDAHLKPYDVQYRLRRHDGVYRWHHARSMPLYTANGSYGRWITAQDIYDTRALEKKPSRHRGAPTDGRAKCPAHFVGGQGRKHVYLPLR